MIRRKTVLEFITDAISIHGTKYDYTNVSYINNHTKIQILCPKHGIFHQTPDKHLSGFGCKFCSGVKLHNIDFIERAQRLHNFKYDYSLTNYIGGKKLVDIICPIHGVFQQRGEVHLRGSGCSLCNSTTGSNLTGRFTKLQGYKAIPTTFYIINIEINNIRYNKIGITTKCLPDRFKRFKFTEILTVQLPLRDALSLERDMLRTLSSYRQTNRLRFNGWTELLDTSQDRILTEFNKIIGEYNGTN